MSDSENRLIVVRSVQVALPECGGGGGRRELVAFDGITETVLAHISERCNNAPAWGRDDIVVPDHRLEFDPMSGTLFVPLENACSGTACGSAVPDYAGRWVAAIRGFTTTFEILQTFDPTGSSIGFRVPARPEGLPGIDWFDTYTGDLSTVGDWSRARSLNCGYPASSPEIGDYMLVADTQPAPLPGRGYYYVTAATYTGQRRYGRQAVDGEVYARDPAVLPPCE